MKKIKNKGFWFIFLLYFFMMCMDFYSTFRNGVEYAAIMEANPAQKIIGWTGIIILNILFTIFFIFVYKRKKTTPGMRFFIIVLMVVLIIARVVIVQNNLIITETVTTIEQAKIVATPEAKEMSTKKAAGLIYVPMFLLIIPFIAWRFDHEATRKDL